jgi:uncharacterized protein (DUF1330 family)
MASVNPTREQFKAFFTLPADEPVHMLNLLRFYEWAIYESDDPEAKLQPVSGRAAYNRYSAESARLYAGVGGRQIWIGKPTLMLIGPAPEQWDLAFVAYYPSARLFAEMVKDPAYQRATRHRTAAVAESRLIRCQPLNAGVGFAPLEN